MPWMSWVTLTAGGIVTGAALVGMLSLRRSTELAFMITGLLGTFSFVYGVVDVVAQYGRPEIGVIAVVLVIGSVLGGYGLASAFLQSTATRPTPLSLEDAVSSEPTDAMHVLLVAEVEPETYDPSTVTDELRDLEDSGMTPPGLGVTPFIFAALKTRYRAAGGRSPSLAQASALAERLEASLRPEGVASVRLVTCQGTDRPDAALVEAVRAGHRRIVVANCSVAESHVWERARDDIEALMPESHGVRVAYTAPLWASEPLASMVCERILPFAHDSTVTGIALVLHGQPEFRSRRHPQFDVQENAFANRVRAMLLERGIPPTNVRLCWAEWGTPDIVETVRHLAALGSSRILVCPVCYPFESIATVLDFSIAIRQARMSPAVYVTTLTAWGDEPAVVTALAAAIRDAWTEL